METKVCTKCGNNKPRCQFFKESRLKSGLSSQCKECKSDAAKKRRQMNPEKHKERYRSWHERNRERKANYNRDWYQNNREHAIEYANQQRKSNPGYYAEYCSINSERERARKAQWRKNNKGYFAEYARERRQRDSRFRLTRNVSSAVYRSLKHGKGGRGWEELVGYTVDELRSHIEVMFSDGMSWDNYGQWHLDHIKPLSSFKFDSPMDDGFREAWDLQNLQPLWAIDNLKKGASI